LQARRPRPAENRLVVNVPLYARRHWRGAITRVTCLPSLARWLGCRYASQRLTRSCHRHPASAQCPASQKNLKNAFRLELPVDGLHIAIVDDVVTTGSTVAELSRLLLQSGAASVQVWCLCRTL
jgi:ComF family protein